MTSEDINRVLWDERAPAHPASPDYHVARFAEDPLRLTTFVEHMSVPWPAIPGQRLPHTFTLAATKQV